MGDHTNGTRTFFAGQTVRQLSAIFSLAALRQPNDWTQVTRSAAAMMIGSNLAHFCPKSLPHRVPPTLWSRSLDDQWISV